MSKQKKEKLLMGWREYLSIPDLGVKEIKAKVDTGAKTSALHISNLKILRRGLSYFAEFLIHPKQHSSLPEIKNKTKIIGFRRIKSSNGISSRRPVILTHVLLGSQLKEIEITLVNRDLMGFRMLLGRAALKNDFIVDPGRSFLLRKKQRRKGQ